MHHVASSTSDANAELLKCNHVETRPKPVNVLEITNVLIHCVKHVMLPLSTGAKFATWAINHHAMNDIQCGNIITWSFFLKNPRNRHPHSSPSWVSFEVSLGIANSYSVNAWGTTLLYGISCYIWQHYDGIQLYFVLVICRQCLGDIAV